jgi:hypothetical protein
MHEQKHKYDHKNEYEHGHGHGHGRGQGQGQDTDVDKDRDKARCVIMSSLSHHQANLEISVRSQFHYGVSVKSHYVRPQINTGTVPEGAALYLTAALRQSPMPLVGQMPQIYFM